MNPQDSRIKYIKRFWENVDKGNLDDCWNWIGSVSSRGYGRFDGTVAHRISWMIHNGYIPDDKLCLHKCDNPLCVNPNHLYIGTQSDNMYDRTIRNRCGNSGGQPRFCDGEVWLINRIYETGKFSQRFIA